MQWHSQVCSPRTQWLPAGSTKPNTLPRCYSTDALIDAALADQGFIYVLDVFVNRLLSQGKLVELFPGWQTYGRTFFTVTPKSRFVAPRTRAFIEFLLASLDAQRRPAPGASVGLHVGRRGRG